MFPMYRNAIIFASFFLIYLNYCESASSTQVGGETTTRTSTTTTTTIDATTTTRFV